MAIGSRRVAKKAYVCEDGPFKGHTLYLASPGTAWLNVGYWKYCERKQSFREETGRYVRKPGYMTYLIWEKK